MRVHERKAAYWLLQAARQGHANSAHLLGIRYIQGRGAKKDFDQGVKWLRKASHRGCEASVQLLAAIQNGTESGKVEAMMMNSDFKRRGTTESRSFAETHEEMAAALRKQLGNASKRVAEKEKVLVLAHPAISLAP